MRGTKHDASQHQRRGIRSRLIASVAAVAMLATSIAAGTAVAADIDETDPTQQNTIVEQPQQGAENAGDQTGEQNTEPEGDQTDQPQESDGTEAETTTEADSTEEADPKADADKTDANQSAEKQSAAVPAPQAAAQSSGARQKLPESVTDVPSTSDSIHVNLYDYTATNSERENVNYQCTGSRCTKRPFTFTTKDNCGRNGEYQWNAYKGKGKGIYRDIVASNLGEDGYPVLNTNRNVSKSLSYLFDDDTPGVEEKGTDVDRLFRQDSDGYYYFDSRNTFAQFDEAENKFDLYEPGRFYEIGEDDHVPAGAGAFMPFNSLKGGDDNTAWYEYEDNDGQYGYRFNESDNYLFGMDLSASFFMPKDGQVNGQDMIFEFEGDDDVWVFIDNVLVLDIGGIHDSYSGSINFSNGKVSVDSGDNTTLAKMFEEAGKTWNDSDYAQHTIRFFYFERGEGSSNCKLKFNLPTVPSDVIDVGKAITDSNTDNFSRAEFTMRVEVSDTENGTYEPYIGTYDLYDSKSNMLIQEGLSTDSDGTFTLRNGQFARLIGGKDGFSATSYYKVYELTANNYDKEDYEFDLSAADMVDDSGTVQTGLIGQSKPIMVGDVNHITVRNKFNVKDKDKYTFTVSKRLASGKAPGQQFELKVTNGEGMPYNGEYYLRTDSGLGNDPKQTTDGVIKLEAGQDAVIMNVAPGTTFKVEEVNLPSGYLAPTYSCSTSADQSCDTVTVNKDNPTPSVTVTNQMDRLDPPTITKKIGHDTKGDGSFDGDSYTLALDVKGDTIDTVTTSTTPLDIVLVLDRSGSMADPINTVDPNEMDKSETYQIRINGLHGSSYQTIQWNSQRDRWGYYGSHGRWNSVNTNYTTIYSSESKMDALREAVNGLIDTTLASSSEASVMHRIGIVSFADSSRKDQTLTEVTSDTVSDLKAKVEDLQANGGTQSDDGLRDAKDLLADARPGAKKVVIFFTDGVPGGSNGGNFDNDVAADAVNAAYDLKESGASVYSIGVFDGANPDDMGNNFNKYMNVVSSNYPEARVGYTNYGIWHDSEDFNRDLKSGERVPSDRDYYLVADDSEGLNKVFQDIYQEVSSSNGYTNVSIVDRLSEYAKLHENVRCGDSSCAAVTGDAEEPITEGVTLEVKNADGSDVQPDEDGYPSYTLTYNPSSKTVKADLGSATLRRGWTYTLKFKVRPTQKAYDEYAANLRAGNDGYNGIKGAPDTDLYGKVTSSDQPGFHSNAEAYVEYDANGETGVKENYPHPVLQVEDTSVKVTKKWVGSVPSDVDLVTVNLMDGETKVASTQLTSGNNWSGSFDSVAPGHNYTIVEEVPEGYADPDVTYTKGTDTNASSLDVQTGDVWSKPKTAFAATVTNTPAPTTYGTNAHLKLHKQLENQELAAGMFKFGLELVSQPNEGDITLPKVTEVANGDADGSGAIEYDEKDAGVFDFGDITFAKTGTYVLKVTESEETGTPAQGGRYSFDKHVLYVRYTIGQDDKTGALEIQQREVAKTDGAAPADADWRVVPSDDQISGTFVDDYLTWHNTYVAPVSSLPLTGGRSTARTLLLAGGGVLLVAGAAWLLARRRRV